MVVYSHDVCVTIAQLEVPCQPNRCCSSQGHCRKAELSECAQNGKLTKCMATVNNWPIDYGTFTQTATVKSTVRMKKINCIQQYK